MGAVQSRMPALGVGRRADRFCRTTTRSAGKFRESTSHDAGGAVVIPGLVDCHTHLAFGGWRRRIQCSLPRGDLRRHRGQGRRHRQDRPAHAHRAEDELVARARGFLGETLRLGVTTVECKSGYGLSLDDELKLLRVYRRLQSEFSGTLVTTFLGADVVPPEFRDNRAAISNSFASK